MKTYLILLNWVFIAAIIGICQWQHPLIAGWAFLVGFLMGAFSTVGPTRRNGAGDIATSVKTIASSSAYSCC